MGFFDSIADAFSRDGAATRFCERIPVVGHVTAGVQALAGNSEHAKRALATSTGALITTAATAGGFLVGGPAGAVVGGMLGSQAGLVTENGLSKLVDDEKVKGDVGELSLGRSAAELALGGVGGLVGGGFTSLGTNLSKGVVKEIAEGGAKQALKSAITTGGAAALTTETVKALGNAVGPDSPPTDNQEKPEKKLPVRVVTEHADRVVRELRKILIDISEDWAEPLKINFADFGMNFVTMLVKIELNCPWGPANDDYRDAKRELWSKRDEIFGQWELQLESSEDRNRLQGQKDWIGAAIEELNEAMEELSYLEAKDVRTVSGSGVYRTPKIWNP